MASKKLSKSNKTPLLTAPEDLEQLFESAKPELEAVPREQVPQRKVARQRVLELTATVRANFAPLVEQVEEVYSSKYAAARKAELARIDTRAWVYFTADLAAEELHSNLARKQRRTLAKVVFGHDQFLMTWAVPMFGHDPEHAETLRDISRGTGTRDDAEDVLRLVKLFRANWKDIEGKQSFVSKARLDQAAADAIRQLDFLRSGSGNQARRLADAAYSLWYRDYDHLLAVGRFLTRLEPDSIARFPGVREARSGVSKPKADGQDQAGEAEAVVEDDELADEGGEDDIIDPELEQALADQLDGEFAEDDEGDDEVDDADQGEDEVEGEDT